MKRHEKYVKILSAIAEDISPVKSSRIASGLVYKNELIAIGTNKYKSHPFQKKYGKNNDSIFLHSEIDCLKNALKKINVRELSKCSLYIVRRKWTNTHAINMEYGLACPCPGCRRAISVFDIKEVFYTQDGIDEMEQL